MKETTEKERIKKALSIAWQYGQINGNQHKMWTIDQMVRALCRNQRDYDDFVEAYQTPNDEYEWDIGIAT